MNEEEIYKVLIDTLNPGTDKGSSQAIINKNDIKIAAIRLNKLFNNNLTDK